MSATSHLPELDLLRRQVADLARDLAERDRVLHEQTRHLQLAQSLAHLGSWNWDIASGEVEWSDELYRIFGYEPRSREITFDSFVSAVLPDDHDRLLASIDDALAGAAPYDMECRIVRPDGEVRTIHSCGEVVRDGGGQPRRISGTALDITDRKQTEAMLRTSQEKLRQALRASVTGLWDWNTETNEAALSQEWKRQLGYEPAEMSDSFETWTSHLHPEDRERAVAYVRDYVSRREGEYRQEFRLRHKDGTYRWIEARASFVTEADGRRIRLLGSHTDITERKRAEEDLAGLNATLERQVNDRTEALRQSEGRFRQFFDNAPNVTALKDRNGRYVYTNRQFDKVFRLSSGMAIGKTDEELFSPEQAAQFRSNDQQVLLNGCGQEFEELTQQEDGPHTSIVVKFPVTDASGHLPALGVIATDITERKRTQEQLRLVEEALRMAHDELERKVIERTAELQASEERYARATAMGKVGVWEMDIENNQYYYGEAHLKSLFGYAPDELSPEPYAWLKLVYPEDQPIARNHWKQMWDGTAHMCHFELRMVKKDGSIVWIDVRCNSVRDPNGRLTRLIGAAVDITDRKRIEEALRDSEERFAKAFRTSPNPIGITEMATGRCIEVNDACLRLFGFRREEVIGHTTLTLGIWPNLEDRVRVIERLKAGQPVRNMEFALKTKSGPLRYLLTSADLAELNGTVCIVTVANDITDRKQAEEALRISEERFAKSFQASPHPVVISELDSGRVVDANDAACRIFGYHKEEVVGQTTSQIGLWHSVEERARYLELLKREGSVRNVEVKLRSGSGEVRQCLLSSELIILNGKQCTVTVGDDITESKRMERALRRIQFSVDHAVEAILWVDPTGRIFNVNETACRMLGYSHQDLTTMSVHDIDPNVPAERWGEHWNHLKEQGALAFDAKYWSRTGTVLEMEATFNYLQYDGKEYGCAILRDIGERKRAEAELHRSHTFLRQVIDTDPDFIFAKDREGRFTMANKAVADWYGTTVEDLIGKSDADFNTNPDEVEFFRRSDLEVIHSGRDRFIREEGITDAGGRTRWLQTVKRPIFDDQGQVHMVLGAATDITERKRMEEILLQRERDLSAALQERERISQDLHDGILQSLYAIGLGLEACKPLIWQQEDKVATRLRTALNQAIGQLNLVMTEVRNFIAGLESQVMQGVDFSTALRTMVETMSISSSARCRVRIDDAAAWRLSTEQALHIINIVREGLSNALRHSRAKQITVSLRDLTRSDRLAVTDDGIGFNTRSVQGVGHGLANMAARAQKVRGSFAVRSKPDKGTRISLDLPKDTHYAHH